MWKAPEVLQLAETDGWLKCVSCPYQTQTGEIIAQGKGPLLDKTQNNLNNFLSDKKILNRIIARKSELMTTTLPTSAGQLIILTFLFEESPCKTTVGQQRYLYASVLTENLMKSITH